MSELEDRWKERWGDHAPSIDCREGWDEILLELDDKLMEIVPGYEILQVKEKFGVLRFYALTNTDDAEALAKANALISLAEAKSAETCEFCGEASVVHQSNSGWLTTECEDCM